VFLLSLLLFCGSVAQPYFTVSLPLSSTKTYFGGVVDDGVFLGDIGLDGVATAALLSLADDFLIDILRDLFLLLVVVVGDVAAVGVDGMERFLDLLFGVDTVSVTPAIDTSPLAAVSLIIVLVMAVLRDGCIVYVK
jgi:hypothetical protein